MKAVGNVTFFSQCCINYPRRRRRRRRRIVALHSHEPGYEKLPLSKCFCLSMMMKGNRGFESIKGDLQSHSFVCLSISRLCLHG